MRWLFPTALALALLCVGGQAQSESSRTEKRPWWFFSSPRTAAQTASTLFVPRQDAAGIMRRDHRRASALLESDRQELRSLFRQKGRQQIAQWEARWAVRDEDAARRAEEMARKSREIPPPRESEPAPIVEKIPAVARDLIDRSGLNNTGGIIKDAVDKVVSTVDRRVVRPMEGHANTMAPGYFALLLAGTFFVPSLGIASLLLGLVALRARQTGRSVFFLLLAGLCAVVVGAALDNPALLRDQRIVVLPSAVEVGGQRFEDVRYVAHDDWQLSFTHSTGAAALPLRELPPAWQDQLGYNEARARRAESEHLSAAMAVPPPGQAAKLREIEAGGINGVATVVRAAPGGFVVAEVADEKSRAPLPTSDSGCAFLVTARQDLQPGATIRVKVYPFGERKAEGGWGTTESLPAYTDAPENLLASAEGGE